MKYTESLLRYFFLCSFLTFTLFQTAFVAANEITLQDYAALPDFDMFTISPNGEMIAYRNSGSGKQKAIIYSREERKVVRVFDMSGINVYGLNFLTDNYLVMQVAEFKRIPGYKGRPELSTAMAYNIEKNKVSQLLTLGEGIFEAQLGLGDIIGLSEDKKYAYMPAFIGGNLDEPEYGVMRVKLERPAKPKIAFQGYRDSRNFFLNKKGEVFVHEVLFERSNQYEIRVKKGNKWETIYEQKTERRPFQLVGVSSDESALILLDRNIDTATSSYYELSISDGAKKKIALSKNDKDIDVVFIDSNQRITGVAYAGLTSDYQFFNADLNARVQSVVALFEGNNVFIEDISDDSNHVLVKVEGSGYAGDYFVFSKGEKGEFIASSRKKFSSEDIHPISTIKIAARDGRVIPNLVVIPKDKVSKLKSLPAVVLPHGGPADYDPISFDWMAQALAHEGYLVIQPQFRGSSGFGTEHLSAGFGEWGRAMQDDITDSLNALVAKGYVDKERVCIMGGSYGGYAALAGGAFTPELYKCVISINGVTDLNRLVKQARRNYSAHSSVVAYLKDQIGGGDETTRAYLQKYSPFNHPENFKSPVLLVHAKGDGVVNIEQSNVMHRALKISGKEVEFIKLSEENHYLKDEASRKKLLENAIRFIDENIGVASP